MKKKLLKITLSLGLVFSFSSPAFGKEIKPLSDCGGSEHPLPCRPY
ncbi:hypothetical protein [Cytobacillus purgationiresistens]|uniref:Uncharacterized protein n=1 Tax=Cytobacillus purgationiresistens TaxID=863449 RepID=A0ABU0AFT4_9BACI|nr:hypothetical protein [Cytobacillus purgationiresistens]MDQ0270121.1 hypothetical protein [Cytobacillus purgationiresistens]